MVYIFAMELKPRMSPALSRFPASQFRGLFGSGADSSAMTAWHKDCRVHAGLQAVFRMSRHTSPVFERRRRGERERESQWRRKRRRGRRRGRKRSAYPLATYLEVDVRVKNLSSEPDRRGHEGVVLGHVYIQPERAVLIASVRGTLEGKGGKKKRETKIGVIKNGVVVVVSLPKKALPSSFFLLLFFLTLSTAFQ